VALFSRSLYMVRQVLILVMVALLPGSAISSAAEKTDRNQPVTSPAGPTASTTPPRVDRIEIVDKGIIEVQSQTAVDAPNTLTGTRYESTGVKITEKTTTIPANKGIRFGIQYKIVGEPADAKVPLKFVTVFPQGGVTNPKTGKTMSQSSWEASRKIGTHIVYQGFSDWSRIPGTWVLQIWYKDHKMAEQKFTIVNP